MRALGNSVRLSVFWGVCSLWLTLRMIEAADMWSNATYSILPLLGVWIVLSAFTLYHCWPEIEKYASPKYAPKFLFFVFCGMLPVLTGIFGLCFRAHQIGFTVDL